LDGKIYCMGSEAINLFHGRYVYGTGGCSMNM
jgi:hypothetical protein